MAYAVMLCPSVRLSVTIVNSVSVKMSNRKLRFFSRSGGFSVPNVMAILRRDPTPLTVASKRSNADGIVRNRDSENIRLHRVLSTLRPIGCYQHGAAGRWKVVTLIVGIKRRSLLMAADDVKMFMTRSLSALRQRQQNII